QDLDGDLAQEPAVLRLEYSRHAPRADPWPEHERTEGGALRERGLGQRGVAGRVGRRRCRGLVRRARILHQPLTPLIRAGEHRGPKTPTLPASAPSETVSAFAYVLSRPQAAVGSITHRRLELVG